MAENPIEKANAAFMAGDFKTALDNWTASLDSGESGGRAEDERQSLAAKRSGQASQQCADRPAGYAACCQGGSVSIMGSWDLYLVHCVVSASLRRRRHHSYPLFLFHPLQSEASTITPSTRTEELLLSALVASRTPSRPTTRRWQASLITSRPCTTAASVSLCLSSCMLLSACLRSPVSTLSAVRFSLIAALKALKRYPEALDSFERALSFNPDFYPSLRGRTDALTTLERYEEAIASATAAIKVKSDDPSPYADRAFAELKSRKLEEAVADYQQARSLGDESHETKRLQAIALSQRAVELDKEGDLVKAEKYYDLAIEFEGTESRLFNRAFLYMRTGRTEKAIEGYKQVTQMAPQNFQARAALGTLLLQREDFSSAIPVLKEASALQPNAADITFNLGFAYLREDELDQAEAQFKRALEIDPRMENAKNGLEAVEAARGNGKFSVQVGGAVEIPAAGGSAELAAKLNQQRHGGAGASASPAASSSSSSSSEEASSSSSSSGEASSSPAAAAAPASGAGAASSPKPSTAAPPSRPAGASPEPAPASVPSVPTPGMVGKPKRDVRMSVAPQLLGALSASVSTGPLMAMPQPTSTEDPDAKYQLDEDGVGGVVHAYEKLRAPGPYPDGVDAGHREVSLI